MGSDLTYRCLGGNSYEITLSFYRDCAGIDADPTAEIFFQSSCFPASSFTISQIPGTGQEISPACPNNTTTCNGGTFTGIQEYIYRGVINLPGPCADWQFSYNLCCRNNAITNINLPGLTQMYIYANLNNTITPCNNSPTFSNKPVPFVCRGQQFCYNHGAYDQDGDSLVYSLITPYDSPGLPVNYSNPWSATNPLSSSPAVTINPLTGDICMTPTSLEITVMAVLVKEYRNGVLIGEVERDIQVTVIDCNNIVPTMTGINGTNSFAQTVCAGAQFCFNISSGDANSTQNTFIDWDYSIPGATFTTYPGTRETATFCWTPTSAQISSNPYCFTVTVRDDNCPYVGMQTYSYCITVTGVIANAGPDLTVACNATTPITASATGGSGAYSYLWNTGANTQTINGGAGTYVVTASDGTCSDSDTALVAAAVGSPIAAFSTNANCSSLAVQFNDQSTITGGTIANYAWNFGDGNTSTLQSPSHAYGATGNYQVQLIVTSASGCIDTLTQTLHLSLNVPDALFTLQNGCIGSQINFTNQSTSPTTINSWMWYFGDGSTSTVSNPAHIYSTAGAFNTSLVVTNIDGCRDSIVHAVTVFGLPVANAGLNDTICSGMVANLTASGGTSYLWNPGTLTTVSIAISPSASTTYVVTVTDNNGCSSTASTNVIVASPPQLNVQDRTICLGATATLTANVFGGGGNPGGYSYLWNPGGLTTQQINVTPGVTTDYYVTISNTFGCTVTDTATVTVNATIAADAGLNQQICPGDSAILNATGGSSYQWDQGATSQQIIVYPTVTTIYTVTVSSGSNCTGSDQVEVTVLAPPLADAGTNENICIGDSVVLNASGGTNYFWSPGNILSQQFSVAPIANTTYNVIVTDANGCSASDQVDVLVNNLPIADAGLDQSICIGTATTLIASGGVSYLWTPVNDTAQQLVVLPDSNMTYTLLVTDTNGCQATDQVSVFLNPSPTTATSSIDAFCFGSSDGSASVIASGTSTPPYSYSWSPVGGTSATATGLSSGMYYVSVTDSNNCISIDSIFVGQAVAINLAMDSVAALCFGSATGSVSVLAGGGASSFTYQWSPSGGTSDTAIGLTAGIYSVTVTDANGCTQTATTTVTQPNLLNLQMQSIPTLCNSDSTGSASVNVSGGTAGYSYEWSPAGGTTANANNLRAGNYSVTVTDANGCTSTNSITVSEPSPIQLTTNTTMAACNVANGSATVNVNGGSPGYTYLWSPGNSTSVNPGNLFAGVYSVIVTDNNGCTESALANVPSGGGPVVNAQPTQNVSCNGGNNGAGTVNVSSGAGPFTFNWTPGNYSNAVETSLPAGQYSIVVTDVNGCLSIDSITITQPAALSTVTNNTPATCNGSVNGSVSVAVSGGTIPYSYLWSPSGGINANATLLSAGNYSVTITDNNGCVQTASTVVGQPSPLNILLNSIPVACYGGNDGSASAIVSGGVTGYTYQWSPSGGNTDIAINRTSGNYTVTVTDANGCTSTSSIFIDQPDPLSLIANSSPVSCNGGNSGSANVVASGGTPFYSYQWSPTGGTNANATSLAAGNYSVTVTDVNGCTSIAATTVLQAIPLTVSVASVPTICIGQTTNLAADIAGGASPYSVLWSTADTSALIQVSPATTTSYTVNVLDANNCPTAPATVIVPVYPPLGLATIGAPPICEGGTANIQASGSGGNGGPYTYSWNDSSIFGASPVVAPINDSIFTVTISDGCSPEVSQSIPLTVYPLPEVDFTPHVISGCTPVEVNFQNYFIQSPGTIYQWDLDDNSLSNDPDPIHTYITPGEYDVTLMIISPEGCTASQTVNNAVTVFGFPVADFLQSADQVSIFQPVVTFTDNSTDAITWDWNFGDGSSVVDITQPIHEYSDSGTYQVRLIVMNNGGCIDTSYGTIRVEPEFTLYVPNAFTPNGDGVNDYFFGTGVGFVDYEMWIMDRWGKEIFHSTEQSRHWDGSFYGNDTFCQNDVYEFIINVQDYKGKAHKVIGHVSLVR